MRKALWILAILAVGCATSAPPYTGPPTEFEKRLAGVRVTANADQVKGCTSRGIVTETFSWSPVVTTRGKVMTEEDFVRDEAVAKGANAAVLIVPAPWSAAAADWRREHDRNPLTTRPIPDEKRIIGEVYSCPQ